MLLVLHRQRLSVMRLRLVEFSIHFKEDGQIMDCVGLTARPARLRLMEYFYSIALDTNRFFQFLCLVKNTCQTTEHNGHMHMRVRV